MGIYDKHFPDQVPRLVGRPWNDVAKQLQQTLKKVVESVAYATIAIFNLDARVSVLENNHPTNQDETFAYWMGD
jgi:hypothetical protein